MIRVFGSPHRYVQGPGALAELPRWVNRLGGQAVLIADSTVLRLLQPALQAAFGRSPTIVVFDGEITFAAAERITAAARTYKPGVVVGIGGGKALDMGKLVARALGCPVVTVPTIASNDAPTSKAVAVYDDSHFLVSVEQMATNPDVVLVDTAVIARAPVRFLLAGIGDAIAKKFEAAAAYAAGALTMHGTPGLWTAQLLADGCYQSLRAHAAGAVTAVGRQVPDEALERTVEACVLLSGLGFENGGLCFAHAMTRGLMKAPSTTRALHGEHVAYGLLVQLLLERRPDDIITDLQGFYASIGLPATLQALAGSPVDAAERAIIAEASVAVPHTRNLPFAVDRADIIAAIDRLEGWPAGLAA